MARRGSFSFTSQRSTGGNLASTIRGLLDSYNAARDQAVLDAWQNGGTFEGKPVTDQVLQSYLTSRRDAFDKTDPEWSIWNDKLTQITFKIGEDTTLLAYKQGKMSASSVAHWYTNQLSKMPVNSDWYRTVADRATQFAKSAVSAARGAARSRVTAAVTQKENALQQSNDNFNALQTTIAAYAQQMGILSPNTTGLSEVTNAGQLQQIIDVMGQSGYKGLDGQPLSWASFQHAAQQQITNMQAFRGYEVQLGRSTKTIDAQLASANITMHRLNVIPDRAAWENARALYDTQVKEAGYDPTGRAPTGATGPYGTGDPYKLMDATQAYQQQLTTMLQKDQSSANPGAQNQIDPGFIGALRNELASLQGQQSGPTVQDMFGNFTKADATTQTDAKQMADRIAGATQAINDIASGAAYYGQQNYGGPIGVYPFKPSTTALFGESKQQEGLQKTVINVDGQPRAAYLAGAPIYAQMLVTTTKAAGGAGQPVSVLNPDGSPRIPPQEVANNIRSGVWVLENQGGSKTTSDAAVVGYKYQDPVTGQASWGVKTATGGMVFTTSNPFSLTNGQNIAIANGSLDTSNPFGSTSGTVSLNLQGLTLPLSPTQQAGSVVASPVLRTQGTSTQDWLQALNTGTYSSGNAQQDAALHSQLFNQFASSQAQSAQRDSLLTSISQVPELHDSRPTLPTIQVPNIPTPQSPLSGMFPSAANVMKVPSTPSINLNPLNSQSLTQTPLGAPGMPSSVNPALSISGHIAGQQAADALTQPGVEPNTGPTPTGAGTTPAATPPPLPTSTGTGSSSSGGGGMKAV